MIVAGVDIGSRTTCALILEDNKVLSHSVVASGAESVKSAQKGMDEVLASADLNLDDIAYIVATGYGRVLVPFAHEIVTEIWCHARGANFHFPTVRTVLDMGGQDCKAIRVDANGDHTNFAMNEKCAAGTGRFLEVMAEALALPVEDIGKLSLQSENEARISSMCTVFARSEVNRLVRRGIDKKDVLSGLHEATSTRVYGLIKKVGVEEDFVISGGIALNIGVVRKVEEKVGLKALIPDEPQLVGALGAALIAREKALSPA
ncbi:acyl-CoA dehydratase activase [Thermodesulfobacteriota bacterium]